MIYDSDYSVRLATLRELGGDVTKKYDSTYEIDLEILNIIQGSGISDLVIDDTSVSSNKTWSSSKIASELADAGFNVEIVTELPSVGDPHTIYFILKSDSSVGDVYDEWMYIDDNWEMVGNTQIDLSDYATLSYVDASLARKADVYEVATVAEIEALFGSVLPGPEPTPGPTPPPTPSGRPANNEIWYVTIDGNIATPRRTALPGMLSNTYENGKGVITFVLNSITINDSAFDKNSGNENLLFVYLPENVTVKKRAFYDLSGIIKIEIPDSATINDSDATDVHYKAFYGVQNITYLGDNYGYHGAKSVNGYLDGYIVYNNVQKTSIVGCSTIVPENITIPNSVTSIENNAFRGCKNISSIIIPDSVTSIGSYAFTYCNQIFNVTKQPFNVTIGNGVTSIADGAFDTGYTLINLTATFTSPTPPSNIGDDIFGYIEEGSGSGSGSGSGGVSLKIYVPAAGLTAYRQALPVYRDFIEAV